MGSDRPGSDKDRMRLLVTLWLLTLTWGSCLLAGMARYGSRSDFTTIWLIITLAVAATVFFAPKR